MDPTCSRRRVLAATGLLASSDVVTGVGAGRAAASDAAVDGTVDPPPLRWTERFDNSAADSVSTATLTENGLAVVAGRTEFESGGHGPWLVALDRHGRQQWQATLDLPGDPVVHDLAPAPGGGVVIGAERRPIGGDNKALVVRLDAAGDLQWQTAVEGPRDQSTLFAVVRAGDEYLVGGATRGDRTSALVARVDDGGEIQWTNELALGTFTLLFSLTPAADGQFVGCGVSRDVDGSGALLEGWLVAVDGEGTQQWTTATLPSSAGEAHTGTFARDLVPTDDGYLVVGSTTPPSADAGLPWVLVADESGAETAERTYAPQGLDGGDLRAVAPIDETYLAVGSTVRDGGASGHWVQGFDAAGVEQWARRQVVGEDSRAAALAPTGDGGLFAAGTSASGSGDETDDDAVVWKLGGDRRPTPSPTPTETPTGTPEGTDALATTAGSATTAAPSGEDDRPGTTSGDGPGLGVAGALAALGAGAVLRRGRSDDES